MFLNCLVFANVPFFFVAQFRFVSTLASKSQAGSRICLSFPPGRDRRREGIAETRGWSRMINAICSKRDYSLSPFSWRVVAIECNHEARMIGPSPRSPLFFMASPLAKELSFDRIGGLRTPFSMDSSESLRFFIKISNKFRVGAPVPLDDLPSTWQERPKSPQ